MLQAPMALPGLLALKAHPVSLVLQARRGIKVVLGLPVLRVRRVPLVLQERPGLKVIRVRLV